VSGGGAGGDGKGGLPEHKGRGGLTNSNSTQSQPRGRREGEKGRSSHPRRGGKGAGAKRVGKIFSSRKGRGRQNHFTKKRDRGK